MPTDLLTALTSAPCGSGKLDKMIAQARGWTQNPTVGSWYDPVGRWHHQCLPLWTTSTDAALSLFGPEWNVIIERYQGVAGQISCYVYAWCRDDGRDEVKALSIPTIPLAICITWARNLTGELP